jgi:hypothetical protein
MNFTSTGNGSGYEERLDALLAARPIVPAPDFVSRTLERVRAEADLVSMARAGDEKAIDALLDHWLADQPLEAEVEAGKMARRARRPDAPREVQPTPAPWRRRLFVFPAWVQSVGALAAAAGVAFMAFFNEGTPAASQSASLPAVYLAPQHIPAPVVAEDDGTDTSSQMADADMPSLNSLGDAAALLDKDNVALLSAATQSDESGVY